MINYYTMLNVSPTADVEAIRKAINNQNRTWANRTNAPTLEKRQEAEMKIKQLQEAETTLLDPQKRSEYDTKLQSAPREEAAPTAVLTEGVDLINEAWHLLSAGRIADALYAAQKATEKDGSNPAGWAVLAQAKFRWGQIEDAIYEYKRAINLKPNEAGYYFDLGTVFESGERWSDAIDNFDKAARVDPSVPMYRAGLGSVLVRVGEYEKAIPILEQCVQEEPGNKVYSWYLAIAYNDMVISTWAEGPDGGMYCTSEEGARLGIEYFLKALTLDFEDADMKNMIETNYKSANWSAESHWAPTIVGTLKSGAGVFLLGLVIAFIAEQIGGGGGFGSFLGFLAFAGTIAIWIKMGIKKGYEINQNALSRGY